MKRERAVGFRVLGAAALFLLASCVSLGAQSEGAKERASSQAAATATELGVALPATRSGDGDRERFLGMWARSYFPGRSGDIMLVPTEGAIVTSPGVPFTHGSPWDYDTEIPIIFYGPGHIRSGRDSGAASQEDVGATLESMLGLPRRPTTTGRVLREALRGGTRNRAEARPLRVVAVLVLDAFRRDYLERYPDETPTLRRLAAEGAFFENARVDYLPTVTAAAHTSLSTGSVPGVHGIVGNLLFDRVKGTWTGAYAGMRARNVMALSLADRWSAATDGRAVIAAQGGTFYPAAALAGHGACLLGGRPILAAYVDGRTGRWASNSECYVLPPYLKDQKILDLVPDSVAETAPSPASLRADPDIFPRFEAAATLEMLQEEPFGEDEIPDLLLANLKSTDYIGHRFGPGSPEIRRAVGAIDEQVGKIVEALEAKAGPDGFVLVITADHGMPPEPEPGGRIMYSDFLQNLNGHFDPEGPGIASRTSPSDNQLYLDHRRLAELGLTVAEVARYVEELPYYFAAYPEVEVRRAAGQLWSAAADREAGR